MSVSEPRALPTTPFRVAVVDDEIMVVSLLVSWLTQRAWLRVVGTAHTGQDGLRLCRDQKPDLVLLDVELPDGSGLEIARQVKTESPGTRILILSAHFEPLLVYQALGVGVSGYLIKQSPLVHLETAIRQIRQGVPYFSDAFQAIRESRLADPVAFHKILSDREIAILMLLAAGFSDAAIAARCGISAHTVRTHRRNIRKKCGAHNDRELIAYAQRWGLLPHGGSGPPG